MLHRKANLEKDNQILEKLDSVNQQELRQTMLILIPQCSHYLSSPLVHAIDKHHHSQQKVTMEPPNILVID